MVSASTLLTPLTRCLYTGTHATACQNDCSARTTPTHAGIIAQRNGGFVIPCEVHSSHLASDISSPSPFSLMIHDITHKTGKKNAVN